MCVLKLTLADKSRSSETDQRNIYQERKAAQHEGRKIERNKIRQRSSLKLYRELLRDIKFSSIASPSFQETELG